MGMGVCCSFIILLPQLQPGAECETRILRHREESAPDADISVWAGNIVLTVPVEIRERGGEEEHRRKRNRKKRRRRRRRRRNRNRKTRMGEEEEEDGDGGGGEGGLAPEDRAEEVSFTVKIKFRNEEAPPEHRGFSPY